MNHATAQPAQGANAQIQYLRPDQFLLTGKAKSLRVASSTPYLDGQTSTIAMNQSGLLETVWFTASGTVAVGGTVTSGTFATYPNPAPFSIIRRMRFTSNQAQNLRDMSGWSWYKWARYRTGMDFLTLDSGIKFSTNTLAAIGTNLTNPIVNGANIVAQTYNVAISMPVPIAYNHAAQKGLLVLQVNTLTYNLQIDWGRITGGMGPTGGSNDLFTSLVGTSLTYTVNLNYWVSMDWYQPPIAGNLSKLIDMVMVCSDQVFPVLNTGDNIFKPPSNDFYTMVLLEFVNNGAPIAVANLQMLQWAYGGIVYDVFNDYQPEITKYAYLHQMPGMDGVIPFDLGFTKGNWLVRDTFQAFNDQNVTDLTIHVTLPGTLTITAPSQCTGVFESLRQMTQVNPS